MEQLESIGYLSGTRPPRSDVTITVHEPDRVYPGLNLYTSGHFPGAILMDMEGRTLHTWERDIHSIWPDFRPGTANTSWEFWRRVHLYENGDLLAIFEGVGIFKLDRNSDLIWENRNGAHHDFRVQETGEIVVLTRKARIISWLNEAEPILEDFVNVLDSEGRETHRLSLVEAFRNSGERSVLQRGEWAGDIFHTNTVHVIDGRHAARAEWLARGNLLVSLRNVSALVVVDPFRGQVVNTMAGSFKYQHDSRILANGNLLLFDNLGGPGGKSRVVEFDPVTSRLHWVYTGSPAYPLYSNTLGAVRRLPNGNTLITESDNGRALEVTPDKTTVWEFHSPHRTGRNREYVASLFEMVRLPADVVASWTPGGEE
jgi:hypothetical protein